MKKNKAAFFLTYLLATQISLAGGYPLHKAVCHGEINTLRELLQDGADPNVFDISGNTPLHYAINKTNFPCVDILIAYGAKTTIAHKKNGKTALFCAVDKRHKSTFLHTVTKKNYVQVLEAFLAEGANPNLINKRHKSLLDIAAQFGHIEIVKLLLKYQADPNLHSNHSRRIKSHSYSPIELAIRHNHLGVLEVLLQSTACFIAKNHINKTALNLAQKKGNRNIIQLLEIIHTGVQTFIANPIDFAPQEYSHSDSVKTKQLQVDFFLKQIYYAMHTKEYEQSFIEVALKYVQAGQKNQLDALIKDCKFASDREKQQYAKFTRAQQQLAIYSLALEKAALNNLQFKFQ